jgi:hypothetical protein
MHVGRWGSRSIPTPSPQLPPSTAVLSPSKHSKFLIDRLQLESNSTHRKRTSSLFLIVLRLPFCSSNFPAAPTKNGRAIAGIQPHPRTISRLKPKSSQALQQSAASRPASARSLKLTSSRTAAPLNSAHAEFALRKASGFPNVPPVISNRYAPRLETPSNSLKTNSAHAF